MIFRNTLEANAFLESCDTQANQDFVEFVQSKLNSQLSVLELGSGAGNEAQALQDNVVLTLSDKSSFMVKHLKQRFHSLEVLHFDVAESQLDNRFDAVISNKVLHQISTSELNLFVKNSVHVPTHIHSFWRAKTTESNKSEAGIFMRHNPEEVLELFRKFYSLVEFREQYEFVQGDSFMLYASNRN